MSGVQLFGVKIYDTLGQWSGKNQKASTDRLFIKAIRIKILSSWIRSSFMRYWIGYFQKIQRKFGHVPSGEITTP